MSSFVTPAALNLFTAVSMSCWKAPNAWLLGENEPMKSCQHDVVNIRCQRTRLVETYNAGSIPWEDERFDDVAAAGYGRRGGHVLLREHVRSGLKVAHVRDRLETSLDSLLLAILREDIHAVRIRLHSAIARPAVAREREDK